MNILSFGPLRFKNTCRIIDHVHQLCTYALIHHFSLSHHLYALIKQGTKLIELRGKKCFTNKIQELKEKNNNNLR